MTISIEPTKIVGAKIGDRVSWNTDAYTWYGNIVGLSTEFPGRIVVEITERGGEPDTGCRHIEPERLSRAPKRYAVGDRVTVEDEDTLPNGTTLIDYGYLPLFKLNDKWYSVDVGDSLPRRCNLLAKRTIAWMPRAYTDNTA